MEHYEPENLKRWTLPPHYAGEVWPEYYVFLGRNRNSDILTNSNFDCALRQLGGEDGDLVVVVREGHWAVGWIEWIGIHQDAADKLRTADEIMAALADYPIVDESDLSEREFEAVLNYWNGWRGGDNPDMKHRINEIKRYNERIAHWPRKHHVPILAARHDLGTLADRYPEFEQWISEICRQ